MIPKPVIPRRAALRDIDEAIAFYVGEGANQAALGFIDAVEQAFVHLGHHPAAGFPRYAHELDLPSVRHWPLRDYPFLLFYREALHHLDVWRILKEERDVGAPE